jgi:N4-(beta-N-acetylglucosaminyl)-L-asparaginase
MAMDRLNRRAFLAATSASLPALLATPSIAAQPAPSRRKLSRPVVISSGNGLPAVTRAMQRLHEGAAPVDAVVDGVTLVEDDPDDMTVGYGGLPNEDGVVQLDASVMDGPSHKAGAVAAIERIRNPARVALEVMRETDHVLIVGDGARRFAIAHGFPEQNLLTDKAREAWLRWKRNLNPMDDWLDDDQRLEVDAASANASTADVPWSYGTIHCAAVDEQGDLGACTTTSGLSYKIPGRVGDSPLVGAGMFVDNAIGAAGATGRGEAVIQSCGAFQVVQHMERGLAPTEACLEVLKWIARHTHRRMLLNDKDEPNFGVTLYAVRKDGLYGSAAMRKGENGPPRFTVHDGAEARHENCAVLYE